MPQYSCHQQTFQYGRISPIRHHDLCFIMKLWLISILQRIAPFGQYSQKLARDGGSPSNSHNLRTIPKAPKFDHNRRYFSSFVFHNDTVTQTGAARRPSIDRLVMFAPTISACFHSVRRMASSGLPSRIVVHSSHSASLRTSLEGRDGDRFTRSLDITTECLHLARRAKDSRHGMEKADGWNRMGRMPR